MKRFIGYARTFLCLALAALLLAAAVPAGAVTFDDSYCERSFKGEKLWTSNYRKNDFYGHQYDTENGVYSYDWVRQIWDKDHKQLYVQERYDLTVSMKMIIKSQGEMLDSVTYGIGVASMSTDYLDTRYKSVDEIPTPEGYKRMNIKVDGRDAVYIYTTSKTPGDGKGVMPYASNTGVIHITITDAKNQDGKYNTLAIDCGINGYNFDLFDSMEKEYLSLIKSLPCTIKLDREAKEFKKGAPTGGSSSGEKKTSVLPVLGVGAAVVGGTAVAVTEAKKKKEALVTPKPSGSGNGTASKPAAPPKPAAPVKPAEPPKAVTPVKPAEPPKPVKTEEELQKERYLEKLKEKYGEEDEKELKKAIMRKQIHNEKMGYIYQADEAWADAALDTAEKSKKVADVTIDVAAELSGPQGKVAKNIYTGLTEMAEATGEVMTGRDAVEAFTEATVDASVGVIENEANGFSQKFVANTWGEGAKNFASTYMKTDGDLMKSLDAANEGIQDGAVSALVDGVTDGLVDKAVAKAAVPAKEAARETLKAGVDASKTFSQDMIKDSLKG